MREHVSRKHLHQYHPRMRDGLNEVCTVSWLKFFRNARLFVFSICFLLFFILLHWSYHLPFMSITWNLFTEIFPSVSCSAWSFVLARISPAFLFTPLYVSICSSFFVFVTFPSFWCFKMLCQPFFVDFFFKILVILNFLPPLFKPQSSSSVFMGNPNPLFPFTSMYYLILVFAFSLHR